MCFGIREIIQKVIQNYSVSFFAGLAASIAVIFSLGQGTNLANSDLGLQLIIWFFVGLTAIIIIEKIISCAKSLRRK